MTVTEIAYQGKTYTCRVLKSNDGEGLIIAGVELLDTLMPYPMTDRCDGFADKEAEKIDEEIFFYTNESDLELDDDELTEIMRANNPDWF